MATKTSCSVDLSFFITGWALMLLLGALYNETLTTCPTNTLCNPTSPWPHPGYWVCVGIMFLVQLLLGLLRGQRR